MSAATERELEILRRHFPTLDCGDDSWRGHLCSFHQGYVDGYDAALEDRDADENAEREG